MLPNDGALAPNPVDIRIQNLHEKMDRSVSAGNADQISAALDEEEALMADESMDPFSRASLCYSLATGYSDHARVSKQVRVEASIEKEMYYFQLCFDLLREHFLDEDDPGIEQLRPYINGLRLTLHTNYATTLKGVGRIIEAIFHYKKALSIYDEFSMALGGLGTACFVYASMQYDPSYRDPINKEGICCIQQALTRRDEMPPGADLFFEQQLNMLDKEYVAFLRKLQINQYPALLGSGTAEKKYRSWVLDYGFFLNAYNDMRSLESIINEDIIHLPSMFFKLTGKPDFKYHGLFNCIKQEYVSARFFLYETYYTNFKPHFSDKQTHILDTLDHPTYSLRIEKLKLVFRMAYSIFDKIAFFIFDYYELDMKEWDVSFRKIWKYLKTRSGFDIDVNFALRGLYWISKAISDKDSSSINPRALKVTLLRNALEHKYVKVYNDVFEAQANGDGLTEYVSEQYLEDATMDLLRTAREAIMLLSYAVHITELEKKQKHGDTPRPTISLDLVPDKWKI